MRAPNNEIVIHEEPLGGIYKSSILKVPFLTRRGGSMGCPRSGNARPDNLGEHTDR